MLKNSWLYSNRKFASLFVLLLLPFTVLANNPSGAALAAEKESIDNATRDSLYGEQRARDEGSQEILELEQPEIQKTNEPYVQKSNVKAHDCTIGADGTEKCKTIEIGKPHGE